MNRSKIIFKNVSLGVLYKAINLIVVFTTIPLLLSYLEKEQYGVWVTIFSIVNIVFFVDAGIGNGLKTKLSEAISIKDNGLARTYISTAYIFISILAILLLIIGYTCITNIDFQNLFNTSISNQELKTVLLTILVMVVSSFVLSLFKPLYYATQQASKVELAMLIYQGLVLVGVYILLNYVTRNLLFVAIIYGSSNILVGLVFTLIFFKKHKEIQPRINHFQKERVKDLMGLSLAFFCIQLCMIVIFTTDNLIISNLIGPEDVTTYDIVYKLFQVVITISVIAQDPFWALYTDAYHKNEYQWIKQTLKRLNLLFVFFIGLISGLYFLSETIISFWIRKELNISKNLILFMSLFVIVRIYGVIYMNFLNSIGKVKLQMWLYVFGAILNIPLSIYFVEEWNFGSSGVILGTIVSVISLTIALPIQSKIILNKYD
jgi:O-antigen/teichoic acid export membrane protein